MSALGGGECAPGENQNRLPRLTSRIGLPCFSNTDSTLSCSNWPNSSSLSYAASSSKSSVIIPAAIASGLPDNVPAWYTGPRGDKLSIISVLAPYAPTGRPPPITLPKAVISGVTPEMSP